MVDPRTLLSIGDSWLHSIFSTDLGQAALSGGVEILIPCPGIEPE